MDIDLQDLDSAGLFVFMWLHCKRNHCHIMSMSRSNTSNRYITLSRGVLSAVLCSQGAMFIRILLACKVNMVQLLKASQVHEFEIFGDGSMFL